MINLLLIILILLSTSYGLTHLIVQFARKKKFLDHPNYRSSHKLPTPRIGGLAFVVVLNLYFLFLIITGFIPASLGLALIVPPTLLASVGLLDDIYQLSNKLRLAVQFIAVAVVLIIIQPWDAFKTFSGPITVIFAILLAFWLVWLINLFNFMDGIDGFAGAESIFILLSLSLLHWLHNDQHLWWWIVALSALPVFGFLFLNWPPAKIFMGDIGSTYLGLLLGIFILVAVKTGISLWSCLILAGIFLCDATWTLFTRILTRQKWFLAHRSHSYQKLAAQYNSHLKVTLSTLCINLGWLLPIAVIVEFYPGTGWWMTAVAYGPLLLICFMVKAGLPSTTQQEYAS
jgi:Fuc2NAc and GlcNAc transferase